jgi:hypothetical protein
MNGNGAKIKHLADRSEADTRNICKILDGQALFTGFFHMSAATHKDTKDSLQPSSMEWGQEDVSQAEQNNRRKIDRISEYECCNQETEEAATRLPKPTPLRGLLW